MRNGDFSSDDGYDDDYDNLPTCNPDAASQRTGESLPGAVDVPPGSAGGEVDCGHVALG